MTAVFADSVEARCDTYPAGEQFTVNFMRDYVNATNREVAATLADDTWTVVIDGGDVYEVPLAAIEGG